MPYIDKINYKGTEYDIQDTALKEEFDEVATEKVTSINRYDSSRISYDTVIGSTGQPQTQTGVFTSDYIECEPLSIIRFYRVTSSDAFQSNNMMYLAQYDKSKTFISRGTYVASGTALESNCYYVRICQPSSPQLTDKKRAVTFDAVLTAQTIDDFAEIAVITSQAEIDANTTILSDITKELSTINKLDMNTIKVGYLLDADGELATGTDVFSSEFIKCEPESVIRLYRLLAGGGVQSNTIMYLCQYDENKRFISRTAWANGAGNTTLASNCHYIRVTLATSVLTDQVTCITFDEAVSRATLSPHYSGRGLVSANGQTKLKVMTYNIGRYSYGVSPYYISSDYDEKVANYKKFFAEQRCDIIGIEENNIFLDAVSGGSHPTNEVFTYLYPYFADEGNGVSLKSKYPMYGQGMDQFTASSRAYVYGTINVDGKEIFLLTVHLTPNAGSTQDELRSQEVAEILDLIKEKEYFIIFGDFNAQTTSFYDAFLNAGCKIANGGYLPFEWTYSFAPDDYSADTPSTNIRYFDNIVTSKNITIDFSQRLNVYADLSSDHIPFVAWLTLN